MKTFILFLLLILNSNISVTQVIDDNPEKLKNNKVRSVKIVLYNFINKKMDSTVDQVQLKYFDKNGFITDDTIKSNKSLNVRKFYKGKINSSKSYWEGELCRETIYYYGKNGNEIKHLEVIKCSKPERIDTIFTYVYYDEDGHKKKEITYDDLKKDSILAKILFFYDKKGSLIKETEYGGDGRIIKKELYKYDSMNRKIDYWYEGGIFNSHYIYFYTKEGDLIESVLFYKNESVIQRNYYQYDNKGNVARVFEQDKNGKTEFSWICVYDYYE